jgi:beta-lactamase class D
MKIFYLASIITLLFSCTSSKDADKKEDKTVEREIVVPAFQTILDAASVKGAILIYDFEKDKYYSNNFEWIKKGDLPASTFKITNSIIALETGVVENDTTLFKWDGERRRMKIWEQDLLFRDAFHFSCVPCYQDVARKIGVKKMTDYLDKFEYGNIKVDSSNIDIFWLEGDSKINQLQQIDFLKRFYTSELPISERTEAIMKRLMVIEETDDYKISGKTGWSIRNGNNNGWFVGYREAENQTYFFATNVEPKEQFDMKMFPMIRKTISYEALKQMDKIK